MNKVRSFLSAGAVFGGLVVAGAIISPLILPDMSVAPMTNAKANFIYQQAINSKCADCHRPGTKISELMNTLSGGMLANHVKDGLRHYNVDATPTATNLAKLEYAIKTASMPPVAYTAVHWGSTLDKQEKAAFQQTIWAKRAQLAWKNHPWINLIGEEFAMQPIMPLPNALPVNKDKVALGKALYHDVALSDDNTVSCASCHALEKGGTDNLATSTGVRGQKGGINAPTVFNAAFHIQQFWDGRAADLKEQAGGPPLNPVEMGYKHPNDWEKIAAKLNQKTEFAADFRKVYPAGFNADTITDAIAEYERTLITPNSPFDKYLKGDKKAMSKDAIKGYKLFMDNGCYTCHSGPALGGQSFEHADLKGNFFGTRKLTPDDNGLMNFTKRESDQHKFRVPTLRNVELTWPYMHDASAKTLKEAIIKMYKYQVGRSDFDANELRQLSAFLKALTGEFEGKPLQGTPCPES
ncbi:MAG: cytochrome c peroxidase [Akkermansia sp.]|nr:cytochrome c peroxidase [Akkermansia sp.]